MRNGDVDWNTNLLLPSDWITSSAVTCSHEILKHCGLLSGLPQSFWQSWPYASCFFHISDIPKTAMNIVYQYSAPQCCTLLCWTQNKYTLCDIGYLVLLLLLATEEEFIFHSSVNTKYINFWLHCQAFLLHSPPLLHHSKYCNLFADQFHGVVMVLTPVFPVSFPVRAVGLQLSLF